MNVSLDSSIFPSLLKGKVIKRPLSSLVEQCRSVAVDSTFLSGIVVKYN